MFKNSGKKIKVLAKVFFVLGILVSLAAAGFLFALAVSASAYKALFIVAGVVVLVLGPVVSWIIGLFTDGFGKVVEKAE